jgi:hypothetical protein
MGPIPGSKNPRLMIDPGEENPRTKFPILPRKIHQTNFVKRPGGHWYGFPICPGHCLFPKDKIKFRVLQKLVRDNKIHRPFSQLLRCYEWCGRRRYLWLEWPDFGAVVMPDCVQMGGAIVRVDISSFGSNRDMEGDAVCRRICGHGKQIIICVQAGWSHWKFNAHSKYPSCGGGEADEE